METLQLQSTQFRAEREDSWYELESLVGRAERRGLRNLTRDELERLPTLYRSAVSSLSVARAISLDRNTLDYLEDLARRSYVVMYTVKTPLLTAAVNFIWYGFPRTVRRRWRQLALSTAVLVAAIFCGYVLVSSDPEAYYSIVPEEFASAHDPGASTESLRDILYPPQFRESDEEAETDAEAGSLQVFASILFTRNFKIGLLCIGLGFAAAAPVFYLLFYNGLLLGAIGAIYSSHGLGPDFWAWVLPHGVTELGAVCLCGMAGMVLGQAVVFPEKEGRLETLAARGRELAYVTVGALIMFLIAAVIESFFRQLVQDIVIRWTLAGITLVMWVCFFCFAGRGHKSATRG
ncbi:MAG: stage II sporulation protein M [Acidobacteriota bacterium]|nr:stage II sporulation protein M [Acidobacteriota bacterium]MDH3783770.1 stage II sporulation protein M [Acidobacteriota bacterium]